MDKKELNDLIDKVALTGPGGIDKIKKILKTILEKGGSGSGDVTQEELQEALAEKQDVLESGVTIKTINNISILGQGNIAIPKGEQGEKGEIGNTPNFTVGSVTTGEPNTPVIVTITGTKENPVLNFTIPKGLRGEQGDTGVSADYPITVYNRLDSDATDAALSAAQGKVLDGKVSQLRQKVWDFCGGTNDFIFDSGNGEHSSNNDRVSVEIPSGEKFWLKVSPVSGAVISRSTVYAKYKGSESATSIGSLSVGTEKQFVAQDDIESIGIYFAVTTRGDVDFTIRLSTVDEKIGESTSFASGEKVKDTSISADGVSLGGMALPKSGAVYEGITKYGNVFFAMGTANGGQTFVDFNTTNKTVTFPEDCCLVIGKNVYPIAGMSVSYAELTVSSLLRLVFNTGTSEFRFIQGEDSLDIFSATANINSVVVAVIRQVANTGGITVVSALFEYGINGKLVNARKTDDVLPKNMDVVEGGTLFGLISGKKLIDKYYSITIKTEGVGSHSYLDDVIPVAISKGEYFGIWPIASNVTNRHLWVLYAGDTNWTDLGTIPASYRAKGAKRSITAIGVAYDYSATTTMSLRLYVNSLSEKLDRIYELSDKKLNAIVPGSGDTAIRLCSLLAGRKYALVLDSPTGISDFTGTESQISWIEINADTNKYRLNKTQPFTPTTVLFEQAVDDVLTVSVSRYGTDEELHISLFERADYDFFLSTRQQSLTDEQKEQARNNVNAAKKAENIAEFNQDAILRINAAKTKFGSYGNIGNNTYLSILVLTDSHSDWTRINRGFAFGDTDNADIILHLGDITERSSQISGFNWKEKTLAIQTPVLAMVGNHDVAYVNASDPGLTDAQIRSILYDADEIAHNGEIHPVIDGVMQHYFYKDVTKNGYTTRLIGLYQFEWDVPKTGSVPDYQDGHGRDVPFYSQTQIDWLVDILQNTPSTYGVVLLSHFILGRAKYEECGFNELALRGTIMTDPFVQGWYNNKHFFCDIIEAFVNGGELVTSTDQITPDGVSHPLSIETSFAGGGKFIANLCGHKHSGGLLKFVNGDNNVSPYRVVMGACTTAADVQNTGLWGRETTGKTQDCLNVVIYDHNEDKVKVIRLGATINTYLEDCNGYCF